MPKENLAWAALATPLPSTPLFADSTFWVVLCYGLVMNVGNFATDQSYVQRYITARDDREAKKSVWLTALLYVPVAAIFFFIGTGLFVFYQQHPELLESRHRRRTKYFRLFISQELPVGLAGLVIAAILAASMDSNLNSMATLTYCDIYQRYFRPQASEREAIYRPAAATLAWGVICTAVGIGMTYAQKSLLDAWWELSGIFSGGVLGLFLLGLMSRRVTSRAAAIAVTVGRAGDSVGRVFANGLLARSMESDSQSAPPPVDRRAGHRRGPDNRIGGKLFFQVYKSVGTVGQLRSQAAGAVLLTVNFVVCCVDFV